VGWFQTIARILVNWTVIYLFQEAGKSNNNWLVVSTPLKNISQLGLLFPIYGKIKLVPNYQPSLLMFIVCSSVDQLRYGSV
jgi:hypothetical protein